MSTVLTWIGTPGAAPFVEANHKKRKPTPRFASVKTLETHISSLARDGVRTHVLGSGILYGNGEADLHAMFRVCAAFALAICASVYLCMCSEYPFLQYLSCILPCCMFAGMFAGMYFGCSCDSPVAVHATRSVFFTMLFKVVLSFVHGMIVLSHAGCVDV